MVSGAMMGGAIGGPPGAVIGDTTYSELDLDYINTAKGYLSQRI